jgi:putative ABC transport system permease protein
MTPKDLIRLASGNFRAYPLRSFLTGLGIAIGITAVVLLTSVGEGIHKFVLAEFTQFGTHLIMINPGLTTTHGASPGMFASARPMTIEDAEALGRIPEVHASVSVVQGAARVEMGNRGRDTTVLGVGPATLEVWSLEMAEGKFLPPDDPRAARSFVVLGSKVKEELFGNRNSLGNRIRVGRDRYRVIGVMEPRGQVLGFDFDDIVFIPTAKALSLFNREGVMEIDLLYAPETDLDGLVKDIKRILINRHDREDFTITTQEQMMDVLGSVLNTLTFAVGALGSISLLVGGVGVLTIMTIAVNERTGEIGLLRAIGAKQSQVLLMFLTEAIFMAIIGGLAGLTLALGCVGLLTVFVPALPVHISWAYVVAALAVSGIIGLLAGVLPARHAAGLDPVEALRAE